MRRRRPDTVVLSEQLQAILLDGPHAHHLTLHDIAPHDELRRLWAIHGDTIRALRPKGPIWFLERESFIRALRREP